METDPFGFGLFSWDLGRNSASHQVAGSSVFHRRREFSCGLSVTKGLSSRWRVESPGTCSREATPAEDSAAERALEP